MITEDNVKLSFKTLKYSKISNGKIKKNSCIFVYSNCGHHIK